MASTAATIFFCLPVIPSRRAELTGSFVCAQAAALANRKRVEIQPFIFMTSSDVPGKDNAAKGSGATFTVRGVVICSTKQFQTELQLRLLLLRRRPQC